MSRSYQKMYELDCHRQEYCNFVMVSAFEFLHTPLPFYLIDLVLHSKGQTPQAFSAFFLILSFFLLISYCSSSDAEALNFYHLKCLEELKLKLEDHELIEDCNFCVMYLLVTQQPIRSVIIINLFRITSDDVQLVKYLSF